MLLYLWWFWRWLKTFWKRLTTEATSHRLVEVRMQCAWKIRDLRRIFSLVCFVVVVVVLVYFQQQHAFPSTAPLTPTTADTAADGTSTDSYIALTIGLKDRH